MKMKSKKVKKISQTKKTKAINITKMQLLQRILFLENQIEELQKFVGMKCEA